MNRRCSYLLLPLLLLAGLLVACGAGSAGQPATETPPVDDAPSSASERPATSTSLPSTPAGNRLSDEDATRLMEELAGSRENGSEEALTTIREAGDTRFVAVLIELMRARQIGILAGPLDSNDYVATLEALSGQEFGQNWAAWVEWYGQTELEPPPGFTGWKGRLLARVDPDFGGFLQDDHPSRIRPEEILWGGVAVDGIPPLENPPTIAGDQVQYLTPEEPVFGLEINGDARAYPLRIIDNHEMVNDVVGGVPISLAYCTLCGAAIAYDGRAPNGETYTFGTSGFLYRSNKLMYDRATRTLWNQLTGRPVLGPLAAEEELRLDVLPGVISAWEDWLGQHPDTLVLDRDTGVYPPDFYVPGVLYGSYFSSEDTMFPVAQRSDRLEEKAFVYTLFLDGVPKAYDVEAVAEEQVVNDTVGETAVVLVATQGTVSVDGHDRRVGAVSYTNGGEVRAYERGEQHFVPGPEPYTLLDAGGRPWQVTETGLEGPDGQVAPRVSGHLAYWFGWYAFFPETLLYTGE